MFAVVARGARLFASAPVTVAFFVATGLGALAVVELEATPTWVMTPPFVLLVLNLGAAIVSKPRFRADLPLLVFHLALLLMVVLLVLARLVYFSGGAVVSKGSAYTGELLKEERGPLHPGGYERLRFQNEGFTDDYAKRNYRNITYNRVRWWDEEGNAFVSVIGDDRPLVLGGYRIYATSLRGFAPLFSWQPQGGEPEYGTVQLGDNAGGGFAPAAQWQLRDGPEVWVMVEQDEAGPKPVYRGGNVDTTTLAHRLIVRVSGERTLLRPGESLELEGGRLNYISLNSWMGYKLVYEPLTPWLVATVAVGVLALFWFYARRMFKPINWNKEDKA